MRRMIAAAGLLLLTIAAFSPARSAQAEGINVISQNAQNRFPNGVQLTIIASSSAPIQEVRLRYRVPPDGANVSGNPQCNGIGTNNVSCTITVGSSMINFLVPGVEVHHSWEIRDAAGNSLQTDTAVFTYQDDRFQWKSIADGNITAYYYSGSDDTNRAILRAARESIDKNSRLLRTSVTFPVKLFIYATAADMQPAIATNNRIQPRGPTSVTLGEVVYSDTALVSRDTLPLDIARHEISHVVMRQATKGHIVELPTWIDEGTAVYSQNNLLQDELQALDLAIRRNLVLPFTSLGSSSLTQTDTSLFYAQAWSVIKFLVETYGDGKFADFIAAHKDNRTQDAMRKVYGFGLDDLENQWRRNVGLPPVTETGGPAGGGNQPSQAATPSGAGQGQPSAGQSNESNNGGGSSLTLIVGAITAVVALSVLGAGFVIARRRTPGPPS